MEVMDKRIPTEALENAIKLLRQLIFPIIMEEKL
jgi:hypothetical protein